MKHFVFCSVIASSLLVCSASAYAEEGNSLSTRVRTEGVNFDSPEAVRAFHDRLVKAAHKVCDVASHSLEAREESAACRARAIDETVSQLNKPALTRRHAEHKAEHRMSAGNLPTPRTDATGKLAS